MTVRNYINGAPYLPLGVGVDADDTVLTVDSTAGYPTAPFVLTIERGSSNMEVVLCTSKGATTFTVTRGWDGTTAVSHADGVMIEHTSAAIEFAEANEHINSTSDDVHTQYVPRSLVDAKGDLLVATADDTLARLAVGATDFVLMADPTAPGGVAWKQIAVASIAAATAVSAPTASTLVKRDSSGRFQAVSPSASADVATKGYTDAYFPIQTGSIGDSQVTRAKLSNGLALSVVGRGANSTGVLADIQAGSDGHVLRRSGSSLGFGQVGTAGIADDAVNGAKIAAAAIGTGHLGDGQITTVKIADSQITSYKIGACRYQLISGSGNSIELFRYGNMVWCAGVLTSAFGTSISSFGPINSPRFLAMQANPAYGVTTPRIIIVSNFEGGGLEFTMEGTGFPATSYYFSGVWRTAAS